MMQSTPPVLAIVLIHHRMQEHLRLCLESIACHQPAWNLATVVAHLKTDRDDGQWIAEEFPWVRLVFVDRFGIAYMRNAALRAAEDAQYVLILDADARVREETLERLITFMEAHPKASVAGPRTLRPDGTLERNAKRFYDWMTVAVRRSPLNRWWPENPWTKAHLMADKDWGHPFECDWVAGAGMLLRAEAIREIGNFDERFTFGFEDVDWCYRAKKADWQVWYCPEATIEHHVQRRSAKGINPLTIEHLKSLWRFWRKHGKLNQ